MLVVHPPPRLRLRFAGSALLGKGDSCLWFSLTPPLRLEEVPFMAEESVSTSAILQLPPPVGYSLLSKRESCFVAFDSPSCDRGRLLWCFLNSPLCLQGGVAVSRGGFFCVCFSSPSEASLTFRLSSPFRKGTVVVVVFNSSSTIRGGAIYGGGVREYVFYSPTPSPCGPRMLGTPLEN